MSRYSSFRTDWQAIAQVVINDTRDILLLVSDPTTTQSGVRSALKYAGKDKESLLVRQLSGHVAGMNDLPQADSVCRGCLTCD
jgi:hypothetical protein